MTEKMTAAKEKVGREKILAAIASHTLTDVLYDSLAWLADDENANKSFRNRADYYANKYSVFKLTEDELTRIIQAICQLEHGNVEIEATFSFLTPPTS